MPVAESRACRYCAEFCPSRNKLTKYTLDLHQARIAPLFAELIARPTHTACIAALREVIAGNPIRDLAGRDVLLDDNPDTSK